MRETAPLDARLELFAHPFSSYCQKVLIALYANATPFVFRMLGPDQIDTATALAKRWPFGQFPVLADGPRFRREHVLSHRIA